MNEVHLINIHKLKSNILFIPIFTLLNATKLYNSTLPWDT